MSRGEALIIIRDAVRISVVPILDERSIIFFLLVPQTVLRGTQNV